MDTIHNRLLVHFFRKFLESSCNEEIVALVTEGRKLIHKRQKLIKIADKNKDGWQVVEEYESDELE